MSSNWERKYEDIINLSHPISKRHPPMPLLDRAAQFSPFAALTGHEAALKETARLTEDSIWLEETAIRLLDDRLQFLVDSLPQKPVVEFSYFQPDKTKKGGSYEKITGIVKKIDIYRRIIIMEEGNSIIIDRLVEINGDIFEKFEEC